MGKNRTTSLITDSASQRAYQKTRNWLTSITFGLGVGIVGVLLFTAVGTIAGYQNLPQSATPFESVLYPLVGGILAILVGVGIIVLFVFLWYLFRAPYEQRNEARAVLVQMLQERFESKAVIEPSDEQSVTIKVSNTGQRSLKSSARLVYAKFVNEQKPRELTETFDIPWKVGELNWKDIPAKESDFLKLVAIDGQTLQKNALTSGVHREEEFGVGIKLKLWRNNLGPVFIIIDPETMIELGIKLFASNSYGQNLSGSLKLKVHLDRDEQGKPLPSKNPYWDENIIEAFKRNDLESILESIIEISL